MTNTNTNINTRSTKVFIYIIDRYNPMKSIQCFN